MAISTGPAIRAVCNVRKGNACGSGSICGWSPNGESNILTNAHVVGVKIGDIATVYIESKGMRKIQARIKRAAYSNKVSADWALLETIDFGQPIEPVKLTKRMPPADLSLYTKGFPKCKAHAGTDITQSQLLDNGVLLWLPDAIPGQSGSGVYGDLDHLQYALLTWSLQRTRKWYGAGQSTGMIYEQNRAFVLRGALIGAAKMPGLIEVPAFDPGDADETSNPVLEEGIFSEPLERGIADEFPWIWAENDEQPPPPPTEPGEPNVWRARGIDFIRRQRDALDAELAEWQRHISAPIPSDPETIDDTFGL